MQEQAGADFLDLKVDEISLKLEEQKEAMTWRVATVQGLTDIPVSVDSSNAETISVGLQAWDGSKGRPMPQTEAESAGGVGQGGGARAHRGLDARGRGVLRRGIWSCPNPWCSPSTARSASA